MTLREVLAKPFVHLGIILLLWTTGASLEKYDSARSHEISLGPGNNGALQLIIQAYVDSILRDIQNDGGTSIQPETAFDVIRERMAGLHHYLNHHPALRQKRLWIGRDQPDFDPFISADVRDSQNCEEDDERGLVYIKRHSNNDIKKSMYKRQRNMFPAEEICGTERRWELVNHTTDFYAQEVEIIHTEEFQQYVFIYRCVAERGPCLGISPLYNSECEIRYGWVNMYHRRVDVPNAAPQWGFVAIPTHCACKITPKFLPNKK